MDLRCTLTLVGDRVVVTATGELDLSTVGVLRDSLVRATRQHPGADLVVDLDAVHSVDDVALGVLPAIAAIARRQHGTLRVVCRNERVLDRLADLGLDQIVRVTRTVHDEPV